MSALTRAHVHTQACAHTLLHAPLGVLHDGAGVGRQPALDGTGPPLLVAGISDVAEAVAAQGVGVLQQHARKGMEQEGLCWHLGVGLLRAKAGAPGRTGACIHGTGGPAHASSLCAAGAL